MTDTQTQTTYGIFATGESRKIISRLTAENQKLIEFPGAEIIENELSMEQTVILKNIFDYDWLIFPEPVAVDIFLKRLNELEIDIFRLDELQICTFGEITADRLRFEQIHTDLIFTNGNENLFELMKRYTNGETELAIQKFLLIDEIGGQPEIENLFEANRLETAMFGIYRSMLTEQNSLTKHKILLNGGAVDEFIITSPNDLISMKKYTSEISENLKDIDLEFRCADTLLTGFLREKGLRAKNLK